MAYRQAVAVQQQTGRVIRGMTAPTERPAAPDVLLSARLHNHAWAAQLADTTGLDVYLTTLPSGLAGVVARMVDDEHRTGPHLRITGRDGGLPLGDDGAFWDGVRVQSFTPGPAPATVEAGTTWEPFGLSSGPALTVAVRSVLVTWRREQEATRPDGHA